MLNIILSLINFGLLAYLISVLFLRRKKTKNQYIRLFNFALFFSVIALILRVISEYFIKYFSLINYSYSSAIVVNLILIFILISTLLRKEKFGRRTITLVFICGLLIITIFGRFYYVIGGLFFTATIILASFLVILSLWIYFYQRQKGAFYFLIYIILMMVAGFLNVYLKPFDLILTCLAYVILTFGILRLGGSGGFLSEAEMIFGKASNLQKITPRIVISFSFIYVCAMTLAGLLVGSLSEKVLRDKYYEEISDINGTRFEQINTFLNSEMEITSILAASTVFRDFLKLLPESNEYLTEKERTFQRLNRSLQSVKQITEIFIIDKNGKVAVSTDKIQEGQNKLNDLYFLEGQKKVFVKSPYYSEIIKKNTYTISAPINDDKTGGLLGVLVIRMDPQNLFNIVESGIGLGSTGETFLIDSDRYFLTPSRFLGREVILTKKIESQNAAECFSKEEIALSSIPGYPQIGSKGIIKNYIDYRGVNIVGTHTYVPKAKWCLITKIDKSEVLAPIRNLIISFVFVFLIILCIFIVIGIFISRRITRPINELFEGVKKIEEGGNFKIKVESQDEIGQLSDAFNKMIEAVKESRTEIENKVLEQTKELSEKSEKLNRQQKAVLNVLADVKEEKNKADVLAHDLEKFKLAVENSSDHIAITDIDGKIIYANKGVEEITKYPTKMVVGQKAGTKENWGGLMGKPFYQKLWKIIKEDKKVFIGEINNRKADGSLYTALASIAPVFDEKKNIIFFVGIERDITKEKQIDKAKTEFVSLASHQLRTPLSAINWYTEMILAGDAGKINKNQKKYLGEVYQASKRMVELINALLNTSRIDLGTFTIEPVPYNIVEIAESVVGELSHEITLKKIKFIKKYIPKKIEINIDPKLTRIIFQNLLSNSVKYTQEKGKVSLLVEKSEKDILIRVIDNGYGIPKSAQDKIFNKLFRADNIKEKDANGTGLGLYIVKAIIEQSGGKIWFESEENKGTTFFVSIPLAGMMAKGGTKELS